jgi:hypothetical protein
MEIRLLSEGEHLLTFNAVEQDREYITCRNRPVKIPIDFANLCNCAVRVIPEVSMGSEHGFRSTCSPFWIVATDESQRDTVSIWYTGDKRLKPYRQTILCGLRFKNVTKGNRLQFYCDDGTSQDNKELIVPIRIPSVLVGTLHEMTGGHVKGPRSLALITLAFVGCAVLMIVIWRYRGEWTSNHLFMVIGLILGLLAGFFYAAYDLFLGSEEQAAYLLVKWLLFTTCLFILSGAIILRLAPHRRAAAPAAHGAGAAQDHQGSSLSGATALGLISIVFGAISLIVTLMS